MLANFYPITTIPQPSRKFQGMTLGVHALHGFRDTKALRKISLENVYFF